MGAEGERVIGMQRRPATDIATVRRRLGVRAELLLAIPPTLIVIMSVLTVDALRHQRILFASLASSAFLIYRDPGHRMNLLRVVVSAHVIAVALGVGASSLLHPGYTAAGLAMVATIVVLIILDIVHPPAIATTLGFAFGAKQGQFVSLFLLALVMVAALVLMQRAAVWMLHRLSG